MTITVRFLNLPLSLALFFFPLSQAFSSSKCLFHPEIHSKWKKQEMSVFEWLWLFLVVGQCFSSWGHQAYWVLTGSRRGLLSYMKLKYKKRNKKPTDIHLRGIRLHRLITYQSLTFWSISSFLTWVPGLTLSFDPQNSGDHINQLWIDDQVMSMPGVSSLAL